MEQLLIHSVIIVICNILAFLSRHQSAETHAVLEANGDVCQRCVKSTRSEATCGPASCRGWGIASVLHASLELELEEVRGPGLIAAD